MRKGLFSSLVLVLAISVMAPSMANQNGKQEPKEVYLIKFVDSVNFDNEMAALKAGGGEVQNEYRDVFKGAAVALNSAQAQALSRNPRVEIIEKDAVATIQEVSVQGTTDSGLWGLDRIDQVSGSDKSYSYTTTGTGVTVYVLDQVVDGSLSEFEGRASGFKDFTGNSTIQRCGEHGTHVAGTIGSKTYGVAKKVILISYKVLNCQGSGQYSWIISALDFVAKNAKKPAVVNMSLGGPKSSALNTAVDKLSNSGVVVVVAAGNNGADACNYSPASASSAITVAASSSSDVAASFSNLGPCVDIFAPGVGIKSLLPKWSKQTTATWNGTSMASPHVAGVVARYLQTSPNVSVATVTGEIINSASTNVLSSTGAQSPNKLIYRAPSN